MEKISGRQHRATLQNYKATWTSLLTNEKAKSTYTKWLLRTVGSVITKNIFLTLSLFVSAIKCLTRSHIDFVNIQRYFTIYIIFNDKIATDADFVTSQLFWNRAHVGGRFGRRSHLVKVDFAFSLVRSETLWHHMKRYHGRLHYDRKFKIIIFLIGYINVNKGFFFNN
jgi:hypothetical protein